MAKPLQIISFADDPDAFCDRLHAAAIEHLPSGDQVALESRYRGQYFGDGFADLSFVAVRADQTRAVVLLHKLNDTAGYHNAGGSIYLHEPNRKLVSQVVAHAAERAAAAGLASLAIADVVTGPALSDIGTEAFNRGGTVTVRFDACVDLSVSDDQIHAGLRKSYKSLVNEGLRDFAFESMTADNADADAFERFRLFHIDVAGRETRSRDTWQTQFDMIAAGHAELLTGTLDGRLVSSALFTDFGPDTHYAVAVYDRDLFDRPLAHANVFQGIHNAKARGQRRFCLGEIPPKGSVDDKAYNIGVFKKGFVDTLTQSLQWSMPIMPT